MCVCDNTHIWVSMWLCGIKGFWFWSKVNEAVWFYLNLKQDFSFVLTSIDEDECLYFVS